MVIRPERREPADREDQEVEGGAGRGRTGCHKFKQQLTFRVKVCGNGPLATRICIAVSERREAPSDTRSPLRPSRKGFTRESNAAPRDANRMGTRKNEKERDASRRGRRLNCSLNGMPDLLIIRCRRLPTLLSSLACHFVSLSSNGSCPLIFGAPLLSPRSVITSTNALGIAFRKN